MDTKTEALIICRAALEQLLSELRLWDHTKEYYAPKGVVDAVQNAEKVVEKYKSI